MFRLFLTPGWFNGWDIAFETVSVVVALLIAGYSWKVYRLSNENRFAYFSFAFLLAALGLGFKIFTSGVLYYTPVRDAALDVLRPVAGTGLRFSQLLYRFGFFLQTAPLLGAWLLIYFISQKPRQRLHKFDELTQIALFVYLVLLISVVANFKYFIFHLTSLVLLSFIVLNYYQNYLNSGKANTWRVMLSFIFILIANLLSVFVFWNQDFYVLGEFFLLLGFLLLLYTYMIISRKK